MPRAQLVANRSVDADWPEANRFMKSNARGIGQGDARVRIHEALRRQHSEERTVKARADATSQVPRVHIRRGIDRPLVRLALAMPGRIRVTGNLAVPFADQPWVSSQRRRD